MVRAVAQAQWPSLAEPIMHEVSATIVLFHSGIGPDVDNIAKPILDALKSLVLADDGQISQLLVRRTRLGILSAIQSPPPEIAAMIGQGEDFIWLTIDGPPVHDELP